MIYRFAQFELDEEERELRRDGKPVVLQPLIFDLLALLVRNHRRVVRKGELLETLWPDVTVTEASLTRAISVARSALGDDSHSLIRTFSGHGYRFCAEVQEKPAQDRPSTEGVMEPQVRYCTTSDGVRIAYTVTGEGPPVVSCVNPAQSHVQLEWSHPVYRLRLAAFARNNTLIRFDGRGCGLSDRVLGQTLDEYVLDIEAVVERTGFERFALSAAAESVPVAILFASRHPERVTRMVLWNGFVRFSDLLSTPQVRAWVAAAAADWTTATEALGVAAFGPGHEATKVYSEYVRATVGPKFFEAARAGVAATWDATEAARSVAAPTLVIKHAGIQYVTMEMTRELVALIPDAQLAVVEGHLGDNIEANVQRAMDFLNGVSEEAQRSPELPSGMTAILFADIAGSTALTERLGDAAFRERARALDGALRGVIRQHAGTPVEGKLLGDGVLAVFTSARQAIEAALACARFGADAGLPLHLGLHAGDVISEEGNIYGGAVNVASRISGLSTTGEVLVSETVRSLARTSGGVSFEDKGRRRLKGVGEPVRVWAVKEG